MHQSLYFSFTEYHVSSGGSTYDLTKKYFSELDSVTVTKLYNIYKVDFEMFSYTPDMYFNAAKQL